MWRSRCGCVIKPAYSFSSLLPINIFVWQNVLYFLDAPHTLSVKVGAPTDIGVQTSQQQHSISLMYTDLLTHSWMYCSKKGEALRLSTGQSKKPWTSFWCRSIVMTCVRPDLHIIFASSLLTMQPRFLILPV